MGVYPGLYSLLHQTGWKELSRLVLTAHLGQAGGYRWICLGREPMENGVSKGDWADRGLSNKEPNLGQSTWSQVGPALSNITAFRVE